MTTAAFLLRFQEYCLSDHLLDVRSGTKTATRIRTEQNDPDSGSLLFAAFPASGGAMTKTSVARESNGKDMQQSEALLHVFGGIATKTKIRNEQGDPGRNCFQALPACS